MLPQLVNNGVDLLPSICDWAEVRIPASCRGVSYRVVAELGDPQKDHQPYVVTETQFVQTGGTQGWAVRTPRYKYVLYEVGKNREMLYDMEKDRGEMCNLAVKKTIKRL